MCIRDRLSVFLVVATQAKGTVLIHQKMFESRLFFVDKLIDMGAPVSYTHLLRPLPIVKAKDDQVFDGFTDPELRYRRRYVDLIVKIGRAHV